MSNMARPSQPTLLAILLLSALLLGIGVDMFVPSMPTITEQLNTTSAWVKFSIGLYFLSYGVFQIPLGMAMDTWDCKPVVTLSLLLFLLACVMASCAHSITTLLMARALQGAAMAGPGVAIRVLLMRYFSGARLKQYTNYTASTWALGVIVAPAIGGYVHHLLSWRAVFIVMFAHALVLLTLLLRYLPRTPTLSTPQTFTTVLSQTLTHPLFMCYIGLMALAYATMVIFHVVGPFLIQDVMGYSVTFYGHIALGLGIAWFMGTLIQRVVSKMAIAATILCTMACHIFLVISAVLVLAMLIANSLWLLVLPLYGLMIVSSMIYIDGYSGAMSVFSNAGGLISAFIGALMVLGVSVASSLASLLKSHSALTLAITFFFIGIALVGLAHTIKRQSIATTHTLS